MTPDKEQNQEQPKPLEVTDALLDTWATDPTGPVALHLKQRLVPVEGEGGVIFPPTYADIGYNIDMLSDGTKVATIDSIGSQANRLEPIFKEPPDGQPPNPLAELVPQIEIVLNAKKEKKGAKDGDGYVAKLSLLDLAHRSADAVVQSSPTLWTEVAKAFENLRRNGDAWKLCAVAPTSLVFGVWDSRGGTNEKRPRLVRAIVRAWDIEPLHAAAQFNSVWKALDGDQRKELEDEAKKQKKKLSEKGFHDAPAVFRKTEKIPKFRDGSPNPEARVLGGILARGRIEREVTVNLVALRGIRGTNPKKTDEVRKYLLGLSLLAATADIELFLREGCHLRYDGKDIWYSVPRRGDPSPVQLGSDSARKTIQNYASEAAKPFRDEWPKNLVHNFDLTKAKKLLAEKEEDETSEPD